MQLIKRLLLTTLFGGLLGAFLFAWLSPSVLVWYFTPPAELGLSCSSAVDWAIHTYRKVMFTGVILGSIVGAILFFAFRKKPGAPQDAQMHQN